MKQSFEGTHRQFSLRVPVELVAELDRVAYRSNRSRNNVVELAIRWFIKSEGAQRMLGE